MPKVVKHLEEITSRLESVEDTGAPVTKEQRDWVDRKAQQLVRECFSWIRENWSFSENQELMISLNRAEVAVDELWGSPGPETFEIQA